MCNLCAKTQTEGSKAQQERHERAFDLFLSPTFPDRVCREKLITLSLTELPSICHPPNEPEDEAHSEEPQRLRVLRGKCAGRERDERDSRCG